jgi:hypothetical protein
MSQSPPSTQMPTQGCIFWDPNDAYGQVFGKEGPEHICVVGVSCASSSVATSSSASQVPYNFPQYVDMTKFFKDFTAFKAAFEDLHTSINTQHCL